MGGLIGKRVALYFLTLGGPNATALLRPALEIANRERKNRRLTG